MVTTSVGIEYVLIYKFERTDSVTQKRRIPYPPLPTEKPLILGTLGLASQVIRNMYVPYLDGLTNPLTI